MFFFLIPVSNVCCLYVALNYVLSLVLVLIFFINYTYLYSAYLFANDIDLFRIENAVMDTGFGNVGTGEWKLIIDSLEKKQIDLSKIQIYAMKLVKSIQPSKIAIHRIMGFN